MEQYYIIPKATIDDIEDSIQRKRGSEAPIEPSKMPLAINTIPSSADGTDLPVGGIYLTKPDGNGNPTEAYIIGYAPVASYMWTDMLKGAYFPYLRKIEFIDTNNIVTIGSNAFSSCTSLTTVSLPASLTNIGSNAFSSCTSLTTVSLPASLTNIGSNAFLSCTSLTTVSLPASLTNIGSDAFRVCVSLKNVTIENGFNCNNLNLSSSTGYSVETMVSWFNALADRTGQISFKLTIGTTNLNKLTAEQKAIATNKNWTLA